MSNDLKNMNVFEANWYTLAQDRAKWKTLVNDCLPTIATANLQTQQHTALNANLNEIIDACAGDVFPETGRSRHSRFFSGTTQ